MIKAIAWTVAILAFIAIAVFSFTVLQALMGVAILAYVISEATPDSWKEKVSGLLSHR